MAPHNPCMVLEGMQIKQPKNPARRQTQRRRCEKEREREIEGYNYGEENVMCRSVRRGVRPRGCARTYCRFPGVIIDGEDRGSKVSGCVSSGFVLFHESDASWRAS